MSRILERAEWVQLGDRLRELSPEDYDEVLKCISDIVECEEVLSPARRRGSVGRSPDGGVLA